MKTTFYRTCKTNGHINFKRDNGYLYTIASPFGTFEFAISKNNWGLWDITHYKSGILACPHSYRTRKEALQQFDENSYLQTIKRCEENEEIKHIIQLLNVHKFKNEEI